MSLLVQISKGGSFYSDFKQFLRTMSCFVPMCQSTLSYLDSKGFSIGSKNLHAVILKNFFCYLQKHFYSEIDFKSRLEHLTLKLPQKEPTALSASEYETVMAYFLKETNKRKRTFHSYRNLFMLKVILLCGVRVSECLTIKSEDITLSPSKEERPSI